MCTLSEGMVSSSFSSFSPFFFRAPQKTSAGDNWVMSILQIQDLTTVQLTTQLISSHGDSGPSTDPPVAVRMKGTGAPSTGAK